MFKRNNNNEKESHILELIGHLESDWDGRSGAAEELDELGWKPRNDREKALYLIAKKQWDELAKLGEEGIKPLMKELKEGFGEWDEWGILESYNSKRASEALIEIGEAAVEPLIKALKDEYWFLRMKVAEILGKIGDKRAVEPLIQMLKLGTLVYSSIVIFEDCSKLKEDWLAQWEAAKALAKLGEKKALEPLLQARIGDLKNEYRFFREKAIEALDELGWEPKNDREKALYLIAKKQWYELAKLGEEAIKELIQDLKFDDTYEDAFWALVKIGEPAVKPLIKSLKDKHFEEGAFYALIHIGEPAVKPLIKALKDENWEIRTGAACILGNIRDKRTVEPLIEALKDEDWNVRLGAAVSLNLIGDVKAIEPLIWALKDENEHVRTEVVEALVKIGRPAVESLIKSLKDENEGVRTYAKIALENIKRKN